MCVNNNGVYMTELYKYIIILANVQVAVLTILLLLPKNVYYVSLTLTCRRISKYFKNNPKSSFCFFKDDMERFCECIGMNDINEVKEALFYMNEHNGIKIEYQKETPYSFSPSFKLQKDIKMNNIVKAVSVILFIMELYAIYILFKALPILVLIIRQ